MRLKIITLILSLVACTSVAIAQDSLSTLAEFNNASTTINTNEQADESLDPGSIIIGHVADAHSWHLFDYYSKKDGKEHAVAIPLPIILWNEGHLDLFWSSRFEHGHTAYKGYALMGGGLEKETVVCVDALGTPILLADGTVKKPLDFSITKTAAGIIIAVGLLLWLVLATANKYKKKGSGTPHGVQSLVEMLVVYVRDEICKPMIGPQYERFTPYLLTLFFFIFGCNILGLIPCFPGGANVTGSLAVTMVLALITFFITNLNGNKHYWKDIFNTPGVPAWLKIFPLMPLVEVIGMFTKPFVLMVRLFANMTAGHIMVLGMVVIIFILSNLFGTVVGGGVSVISVLFTVFIDALECLVAYIQAFVFTMLSAVYIGMAVADHEEA